MLFNTLYLCLKSNYKYNNNNTSVHIIFSETIHKVSLYLQFIMVARIENIPALDRFAKLISMEFERRKLVVSIAIFY